MIKGKSFLFAIITTLSLTLSTLAQINPDYPIKPVPFTNVHITDRFWTPRLRTNQNVTIPYAFWKCEETGRISNFEKAAGLIEGKHEGFYFNDSDLYKIMEGAAYSLQVNPDKMTWMYLDKLIKIISAAQWEDGYLFTYYSIPDRQPEKLWTNVANTHEQYCAGHMYEAAVAHYQVTEETNFLNIAIKNADLMCEVFNPEGRTDPPGHEEIEIGLCKLYRATGNQKYLNQAKFFLDQRGREGNRGPDGGRGLYGIYAQDHKPVTEQTKAVGHSVRAAYLYTGMADVAALTGDMKYVKAIDTIWEDVVDAKMYVTGGIGARGGGEAFGDDYELPNLSAYCETCAAIGNIFWNHRMFLLHGHAKYIDILERTLYNGLLSGISLSGDKFFYQNPLESYGQHERSPWFGCACCPSNITRFIPAIPGYIYAHKDNNIYVNLFISGKVQVNTRNNIVTITQETRYPWDGGVKITVEPEKSDEFTIYVRIPGWVRNQPVPSDLYHFLQENNESYTLKINNQDIASEITDGFACLERKWNKGDIIELNLPMPVRRVIAHKNLEDDKGKAALQRGPVVYCAEWPDYTDGHVSNLLLQDNEVLDSTFRKDLLNGIQVIEGQAVALAHSEEDDSIIETNVPFLAIPYYAWAHRGPGQMVVWLPRNKSAARALPAPTIASKSNVTTSGGTDPQAVNDQLVPENSNDHSVLHFHWWPKKGSKEWVTFSFDKPQRISTIQAYWFDDTGEGECRTPESWKIFYKKNDEFKSVINPKGLGTEKDKFNNATFEPVKTNAIRIEVNLRENFSAGIYEVRIE